ncbi:MAG: HlyD family type I secretion periplasmic adaptor subunit [Desulfovibrionaceae bacterium]|nr:HlyD family type I secretion periplasmic adaptor subunit [Desulfovibrionaceae bacterium]
MSSLARQPEDLAFMSEVDAALHREGHPLAYIVSVATFAFFFVAVIWAAFAELDEVTRGNGQVIPSQRIQEISNLEGGLLAEMLVAENQIVEKDQVLARISNEQAESTVRDNLNKQAEAEAAILRLEAERNGTELVFPKAMEDSHLQIITDQLALYNARRTQFEGEMRALEAQLEQKNNEMAEAQARRGQLEENLRLVMEQRNIARPLMLKGTFSRVDYLKLEQQVATLQGDVAGVAQSIARARNGAQEIQERINQRRSEKASQIQEEINKRRLDLNSIRETLAFGGDRTKRMDVRAPMRGTIKRTMINTVGGVIKPGETVIELVPLDDTLLIEARIKPTDIAFLHPDQKAVIKITAYDFSIYGGLEGSVEQISADTIEDKKGETYYLVKLRTKRNAIVYRGESLPIIPGMTASVDILTGKKSVLDYLLKPILKAKQNALRER